MDYWVDTFNRFYEEYAECFMSEENQILTANVCGFSTNEKEIRKGKAFEREELAKMFDFVNSKPEEKNEENS